MVIGSPVIVARNLTRVYRRADKRPGVRNALRYLLRPTYRYHTAVADLNLTVEAGEAVAYVGPNGAGKSTTIKLLTGILEPTAGEVRVCGLVPHRDRTANARNIGVVFGQRSQLWWDLPVRDSLGLLRDMYRLSAARYRRRLDELDAVLGIGELMTVVARKLSLGQRMRADLAAALLHSPRVVYLDEPTIGLDLITRDNVRAFLRRLPTEGTTLLLTTHDLADIEETCGRLIVVDEGRVVADGSLATIRERLAGGRTIHFELSRPLREADLDVLSQSVQARSDSAARRISVTFRQEELSIVDVVAMIAARAEIVDLTIEEPSVAEAIRRVYAGARTLADR